MKLTFGKTQNVWRVCRRCELFRNRCARVERRSGMCCTRDSSTKMGRQGKIQRRGAVAVAPNGTDGGASSP